MLTPYIIYAQIGFSTNRQTFNKNIVTAEKSPIFTSHKSLYEHVVFNKISLLGSKQTFSDTIKLGEIQFLKYWGMEL